MTRKRFLKRRQLIAAAVLLIGIPVVSVAILSGHSPRSQQPTDNAQLEVELVTLLPARFEPAEIVRPKGSFVLFVDDRSGRESSSLVLQRSTSERLRAITIQRKKSEWNEVLDLSPGNYVLQDASNPEWRCQVTILP
jgi:hypothetical protein